MTFLLIALGLLAAEKVWDNYSASYRAKFHGVVFKRNGRWVKRDARQASSTFWNLHPRAAAGVESLLGLGDPVRGLDVDTRPRPRKGERARHGWWSPSQQAPEEPLLTVSSGKRQDRWYDREAAWFRTAPLGEIEQSTRMHVRADGESEAEYRSRIERDASDMASYHSPEAEAQRMAEYDAELELEVEDGDLDEAEDARQDDDLRRAGY